MCNTNNCLVNFIQMLHHFLLLLVWEVLVGLLLLLVWEVLVGLCSERKDINYSTLVYARTHTCTVDTHLSESSVVTCVGYPSEGSV